MYMERIGRPTKDPTVRYTVHVPKSLVKYVQPQGLESYSARIKYLIKLGVILEQVESPKEILVIKNKITSNSKKEVILTL